MNKTILVATLVLCAFYSVLPASAQKPSAQPALRATLIVKEFQIKRSVLQQQTFDGGRFVLLTSVGNETRDHFYGAALILHYKINPTQKGRTATFTEKNYLVEESHDFNLWKYFERSWTPDKEGIWTDALVLGDNTPLPSDYRRTIRQELFCNGMLFSKALVTFTATNVQFQPLPLIIE